MRWSTGYNQNEITKMRGINSSWLLDIDQRSTDRLNWEDLPLGLWRGPETGPPRAHSYLTQLMSRLTTEGFSLTRRFCHWHSSTREPLDRPSHEPGWASSPGGRAGTWRSWSRRPGGSTSPPPGTAGTWWRQQSRVGGSRPSGGRRLWSICRSWSWRGLDDQTWTVPEEEPTRNSSSNQSLI